MSVLLALAMAIAAIASEPKTPDAFINDVLYGCAPVVDPGTFIGCRGILTDDNGDPVTPDAEGLFEDDQPYAGIVWIDGQPVLQTGP